MAEGWCSLRTSPAALGIAAEVALELAGLGEAAWQDLPLSFGGLCGKTVV